jgi:hypothetical protein
VPANRGNRRTLRRIGRGDYRREPLVLYADDRYGREMLAGLARLAYRHRSALAHVMVGLALAVVGAVLHGGHPGVSPVVAAVSVMVSAGLAWPRGAPELRRLERVYAIALVVAGPILRAADYGDAPALNGADNCSRPDVQQPGVVGDARMCAGV